MRSVAIAAALLSFALVGHAAAQAPLGRERYSRRRTRRSARPARRRRTRVIDGVVYDRVPVRVLFITGPRYTEPSGVRIGRGSVIPDWLAADPMRNVSIRRLRPGRFYSYFVSPDNKVVIFDPGTRRVARIVSRAG